MVGTLVEVGNGKLTTLDLENAFSTGARTYNGKTLPAKGLCLLKVEY
jgi:tRNA U38,U39,U40 pseudouridine synthase TruA